MPIFAACAGVLVLAVAIALELGRWVIAQNELRAALDAGVLAGAARLQTNYADKQGAIEAARTVFNLNKQKSGWHSHVDEMIDFEIQGLRVFAVGEAKLKTILSDVVKTAHLPLISDSEATLTNSTFEMALALDITGSMCRDTLKLKEAPCTSAPKLDAMKAAAKELVQMMLANEGLRDRVRLSVVPFSDGVRLPSMQRVVAAGPTLPMKVHQEKSVWGTFPIYYHGTGCVAERTGSERYTDAGPGLGQFVTRVYVEGKNETDSTPQEFGCSFGETATVVPLTNDKDELIAKIDGLSAKGGTAGHLGTAWAWYTLSPNWSHVWSGKSDDAAPYSDVKDKTLRKIAVLMSDGKFNRAFSVEGYMPKSHGYSGAANGTSEEQALALCNGMKAKGIEVYTIGFEVNSSAEQLLRDCATSSSHMFLANSGYELMKIFKGIGERSLSLRLTQ